MTRGNGLYRARRKPALPPIEVQAQVGLMMLGPQHCKQRLPRLQKVVRPTHSVSEGVPPPANSDVIVVDSSCSNEGMIDASSSAGSDGLDAASKLVPETRNGPVDQVPQQNLVLYPEENEIIPPLVLDTWAALMGVAFSCGECALRKVQFAEFRDSSTHFLPTFVRDGNKRMI